jgi:GntR family transcriptional repressor for pyruvate dehydrogenase complex
MVIATGEPVGRSIRAAKTGEMIAAYLRGRIVRGELVEGESLPSEVELMEQFDVSRPTLREAFRILETEQLIVIRRGSRGARILAPEVGVAARHVGLLLQVGGTTLADVYQARAMFEAAAVGMLAERCTEQDIEDLSACVQDLENQMNADATAAQVENWAASAQRFHALILERAGNQTMAIQSGVLAEVVTIHLTKVMHRPTSSPMQQSVRSLRRSLRSYRTLIELLAVHDADAAQKHWRSHMEGSARSLLKEDPNSATVLDLFA